MTEHIVAVFDSERPAAQAARELEDAGVPKSAIRQYKADREPDPGNQASDTTATHPSSRGGFWAWLLGEDAGNTQETHPDDAAYNRHARAGNTILNVTLSEDSMIHRAVSILDAHHPLDVDESTEEPEETVSGMVASGVADEAGLLPRERENPGRHGARSADMASSNTGVSPSLEPPMKVLHSEEAEPPGSAATGAGPSGPGRQDSGPGGEEGIGGDTRSIDRGTARVRRYVVADPERRT